MIIEWCQDKGSPNLNRYGAWYWTAFLATYGPGRGFNRAELLRRASSLARADRAKPDYAISWGSRICECHMEPRFLNLHDIIRAAVWEGHASASAWHHLPLVKAYVLALIAGEEALAEQYLNEFAGWRTERHENFFWAFEIAEGIDDLARAHALAREIVGQNPQAVYFFCRRKVNDPDLLERARQGLLSVPGLLQANHCARVTEDTEFLAEIAAAQARVAV